MYTVIRNAKLEYEYFVSNKTLIFKLRDTIRKIFKEIFVCTVHLQLTKKIVQVISNNF